MAHRALTWQEVVIVLLTLCLLPASVMAYGGNIDPPDRAAGRTLLVVTAVLIGGFAAWDVCRLRRQDVLPDVLAESVPAGQILQAGHAQFALGIGQDRDRLTVQCVAQNVMSGDCAFTLHFVPTAGQNALAAPLPPLVITLPPAGVVEATCSLALAAVAGPTTVRWRLEGAGRGVGRQVRFARRTALAMHVPKAVSVMTLLGGHLVHGGGTTVSAAVVPPTDRHACPPLRHWHTRVLWQPSEAEMLDLAQRTA